ncbi:hypothetical protein [uncultured Ruegeria sp.]|uniref:hypothetical protein n=1 Tax=uncultured Ruegeria sp. TaxID=259304 RepID=UPI002638BFDD|nr:hypothetical protein [uncultured Ruegeria sp.]
MSGPSDTTGLSAGFAAAMDVAPSQSNDVEQGSLFGRLPADPQGVGDLTEEDRDLRRGRGRPPGAKNRSTDEWARFLLTRYRSPLIGMAEIAQASPEDLQVELGGAEQCSLVDALRIIQQAQRDLAPYLHQKQPTAIDTGGRGLFQVIIGDVGTGDDASGVTIRAIGESEENQGVTLEHESMSEEGCRKE